MPIYHGLTLGSGLVEGSAKYDALTKELHRIGISASGPARAVIFAERVEHPGWLRDLIAADLKLSDEQIRSCTAAATSISRRSSSPSSRSRARSAYS